MQLELGNKLALCEMLQTRYTTTTFVVHGGHLNMRELTYKKNNMAKAVSIYKAATSLTQHEVFPLSSSLNFTPKIKIYKNTQSPNALIKLSTVLFLILNPLSMACASSVPHTTPVAVPHPTRYLIKESSRRVRRVRLLYPGLSSPIATLLTCFTPRNYLRSTQSGPLCYFASMPWHTAAGVDTSTLEISSSMDWCPADNLLLADSRRSSVVSS